MMIGLSGEKEEPEFNVCVCGKLGTMWIRGKYSCWQRTNAGAEWQGHWGFWHLWGCAVQPGDYGPELCLHPVSHLNTG